MGTTTTSRAGRIVSRIAATWSELDYAQRRLLEIQTGLSGLTRRPGTRRSAAGGGPDPLR